MDYIESLPEELVQIIVFNLENINDLESLIKTYPKSIKYITSGITELRVPIEISELEIKYIDFSLFKNSKLLTYVNPYVYLSVYSTYELEVLKDFKKLHRINLYIPGIKKNGRSIYFLKTLIRCYISNYHIGRKWIIEFKTDKEYKFELRDNYLVVSNWHKWHDKFKESFSRVLNKKYVNKLVSAYFCNEDVWFEIKGQN